MRGFGQAVALALLGYGSVVTLGLVAHEAAWVGWASLALGAVLLVSSLRAPHGKVDAEAGPRPAHVGARVHWALAALGGFVCLGTLAYNLARGSGLTGPETALVAYGALLVACLPWLHRSVGPLRIVTAVVWSIPTVLAPLAIYALNGVLTSQAGAQVAAASPLVRWSLVAPTAGALELLGHDVEVRGNALVLATPRGTLTLSVGLVCAGIYPAVLFAGLFALYVWDRRPAWQRALAEGIAGLTALWIVNLVRLTVLAEVGVAHGPSTLQAVHDHIGWILFSAFSAVYWGLVLRRPGGGERRPSAAA